MSDASLVSCVMSPSLDCLHSPRVWFAIAMLVLSIGAGFIARRIDVRAFRRIRTLALRLSLFLLAALALAAGYFLIFDRATVDGVDTSSVAQTAWVVVVSGLGGAFAMFAAALGLSLGGRLAKIGTKKPRPMAKVISSLEGVVIAIDGPAASGKGTLARRIAQHFDVQCLDTGLLYRAVARDVMAAGKHPRDVDAAVAAARVVNPETFDDPKLRGPEAGDAASLVAKIPEVRAALLDLQRTFARHPKGAVLDGRDIGTVVCPDANVKIYVTASPEERARRRHREHQSRGETSTYESVLEDIRRRDARDSGRDIAPMGPASDAIVLDTTSLDADAVFSAAMAIIRGKLR